MLNQRSEDAQTIYKKKQSRQGPPGQHPGGSQGHPKKRLCKTGLDCRHYYYNFETEVLHEHKKATLDRTSLVRTANAGRRAALQPSDPASRPALPTLAQHMSYAQTLWLNHQSMCRDSCGTVQTGVMHLLIA